MPSMSASTSSACSPRRPIGTPPRSPTILPAHRAACRTRARAHDLHPLHHARAARGRARPLARLLRALEERDDRGRPAPTSSISSTSCEHFVPPARIADKPTYSAFESPEFRAMLDEMACRTVICTGVETDVCVLATVMTAMDRGYRVVLPSDGVHSSDADRPPGRLSTTSTAASRTRSRSAPPTTSSKTGSFDERTFDTGGPELEYLGPRLSGRARASTPAAPMSRWPPIPTPPARSPGSRPATGTASPWARAASTPATSRLTSSMRGTRIAVDITRDDDDGAQVPLAHRGFRRMGPPVLADDLPVARRTQPWRPRLDLRSGFDGDVDLDRRRRCRRARPALSRSWRPSTTASTHLKAGVRREGLFLSRLARHQRAARRAAL